MEMRMTNPKHSQPLAITLILTGAASRLLPHIPNFTAVGGIGLFAGARLKGWKAFLVPLFIMTVTDPILAGVLGYPAFNAVTLFVYASLLVNVMIGRLLKKSAAPGKIAGASLICSIQFYLVTNFALWAVTPLFPPNWAGLAACYIAGLPYLGYTVAGDLTYSVFLFGAFHLFSRVSHRAELPAIQDRES